jgi:RNA polymerase sigma-70 factor (ECF subfamily)
VPAPSPRNDADEDCLRAFQEELDYVHRTVKRLGAVPSDVEDLMQEVFLALRGSWHRCDKSRPLRPYLFGIAFRVVSAHRRKRRREIPFGIIELPDHHADLDDGLQSREARHLVLAALEGIPLRRRAVLIMHELDEVPVAAVAAALKSPKFTVYSRLRKARRELASALRRMLGGRDVGWRHVFEDHPRWALACSP